jgi:predicted Zn finger-like uncharacterized protein
MNQPEAKAEVVCKNCGTTFSAFLQQMAEHNQKVVCPKCGQTQSPSDIHTLPSSNRTG